MTEEQKQKEQTLESTKRQSMVFKEKKDSLEVEL